MTKPQEITLTQIEARFIRSMLINWINEMGTLFNDPELRSEENALRKKFEIEELEGV